MSGSGLKAEDLEIWDQRWHKGEVSWKAAEVSGPFARNLSFVEQSFGIKIPTDLATTRDEAPQALVPLAGDSKIVPFLHDLGFAVTAIEYAATAIELQISNNFPSLTFTTSPVSQGRVSSDGRVTFLQGDYFEVCKRVPEGSIDFVYDRASIVAINPRLRTDYAQLVDRTLRPGGVMYLETVLRKAEDAHKGPPFMVPTEQITGELYPDAAYESHCEAPDLSDLFKTENPKPFVSQRIALRKRISS
jgi:thiopurine S-methyltransferase